MLGLMSHRIGAMAELEAQKYYLKEGYDIFTPIMPQSKCDFIATKDSVVTKIQVKKATENPTKSGTYLQVRIQGKPTPHGVREYAPEDFDTLFIVHEAGMWAIPSHLVLNKTSITFGKLQADGSVTYGPRSSWAEEFEAH